MDNFHLMAKPAGPACNLNCTYCFYLEKNHLFETSTTLMSDEVLEAYIKKYIRSQKGPQVDFAWQGGEPTMAGLDFFKKAIQYQKQYGQGKQITNALQTNGTLINDEWCRFLKKNNFLLGLSLDGPAQIHNTYRVNNSGKPTFHKVERAIKLFKKHRIDFNVLTTVNAQNVKEPMKLYDYYKDAGIDYIQFIPIVERTAGEASSNLGLSLGSPEEALDASSVTPWSVEPKAYGQFLIAIFDRWVGEDIGTMFFMNIEWALSSALHGRTGTCQHAETCGTAGIVEHNGDIYSCDHFVYPSYKIGNILEDDPAGLFNSYQQLEFGEEKRLGLTKQCQHCKVLKLCYGGCPKHRFDKGQNYLCPAYKMFFSHILPYGEAAKKLIAEGRPLTSLKNLGK